MWEPRVELDRADCRPRKDAGVANGALELPGAIAPTPPRPLPRPGFAGGGATETRSLGGPEKPELA